MSLEALVNNGSGSFTKQELGAVIQANNSPEVRNSYLSDINGIFGKALNLILSMRGYKNKMPDHYIYLNMPEKILAATIISSDGNTILAYNKKHADEFASNPLLRLYVNLHEHAHVRGEKSEHAVDGFVGKAARKIY